MENKTWILRDSDGNLPTEDEASTFRDWLVRDKFAPKVWCKESYDEDGNGIMCEWRFAANETGKTMIAMSTDLAMLKRLNNHHVEILEQVKLAVAAKDFRAACRLLGIEG
jgi:hypothetical protein